MNLEENESFCKTKDSIHDKSIRNLGKTAIESYKNLYFNKDQILYEDWKSKIRMINREEALERKMGSYLDDVIQSDYLKKYRPILIVKEGSHLMINYTPLFTYDVRSLLKMQECPYDFFWTYDEAIELSVLRRFSLLWWKSDDDFAYQLGKLIYDNREHCNDKECLCMILRFYYMTRYVAEDLQKIHNVMDDCIRGMKYYLEIDIPNIPDFVNSKKATKVWEEFTHLGYMVKKSKRYVWVKDDTKFALFIVMAHRYLARVGPMENINWNLSCTFFGVSKDKIGSLKNITTRLKNGKVAKSTIKEIKRGFKYVDP